MFQYIYLYEIILIAHVSELCVYKRGYVVLLYEIRAVTRFSILWIVHKHRNRQTYRLKKNVLENLLKIYKFFKIKKTRHLYMCIFIKPL